MIYCKLKGGLGNMMFQIAGVMSLALNKGVECSFINLESHLNTLVEHNIKEKILTNPFEYLEIIGDLKTEIPNASVRNIHYPFHYHEEEIGDEDVLIYGFFQSEKYFLKYRNEILKSFSPTERMNNLINDKYSDMLGKRTTAIHIRRGDYMRLVNHHPSPSLGYFTEAMNLLKDDTDLYVVFSDDIQWCKNNINTENVYFVENEKDYIEMFLISMCNNMIISNSSFSWWGAWLCENINKKIIAPKIWFGHLITENIKDIIPDNWIKI